MQSTAIRSTTLVNHSEIRLSVIELGNSEIIASRQKEMTERNQQALSPSRPTAKDKKDQEMKRGDFMMKP
jgi:hypothetical protein